MNVPIPSPEERIKALLAAVGERALCRGCAAPIAWVTHRNGKKTPYDVDCPTQGTNHFCTCPQAAQFKRSTR